jgi:hypothetical protein
MFEKLKVTAVMRSPFIRVGFMTLDGLLAAIRFEETGDIEIAHSDLPLCQTDGLWHASAALYEAMDKGRAVFIAGLRPGHSLDPDLIRKNKLGQLHRKFDSTFTNVMNAYPVITAPTITWYAEGDAKRITRMLEPVNFIGKRRASGYGEIRRWVVEPDELDGVVGPFGEPLRPVPVDMFKGDRSGPILDAAWRPAYWNVENRTPCFAPL